MKATGVLVEFLTVGVGGVSGPFDCSWNPFPPTGLLHPALLRLGFVPSLSVTCYAVLCLCPWEGCSFLKVNKGGMALEERGDGGILGGVERRKIVVRV